MAIGLVNYNHDRCLTVGGKIQISSLQNTEPGDIGSRTGSYIWHIVTKTICQYLTLDIGRHSYRKPQEQMSTKALTCCTVGTDDTTHKHHGSCQANAGWCSVVLGPKWLAKGPAWTASNSLRCRAAGATSWQGPVISPVTRALQFKARSSRSDHSVHNGSGNVRI